MTRFLTLAVYMLLPSVTCFGQEVTGKQHIDAIARVLDDQTVLVAFVDLSRIDVSAAIRAGGKTVDATEEEMKKSQEVLGSAVRALREAGARKFYAISSLTGFPTEPFYVVVPLEAGVDAEKVSEVMKNAIRAPSVRKIGNAIVGAREQVLERLEKMPGHPDPKLARALDSTGDSADVIIGIVLPDNFRKALGEVAPRLPEQLGNLSIEPVIKGFQWMSVRVSILPELSIKTVTKAANPQSAKVLSGFLEHAVANAMVQIQNVKDLAPFAQLASKVKPKIENDSLVMNLDAKEVMDVVRPAVVKVRAAATRMQSSNNLKQLGLALHNHHDTHGVFPAAAHRDANGKALLSWRVQLLPFIGRADLYKQFKLDEPWDSPHNKKLISEMPEIFCSPTMKAVDGKTTYVAPITKSSVIAPDTPTKITRITDGTSNTIMVVEANEKNAVIWTKPEDVQIDPRQPAQGLGGEKGIQVLFADGSVRVISPTVTRDVLNALYSKDGGEVINQEF